jgi:hypothetical protein
MESNGVGVGSSNTKSVNEGTNKHQSESMHNKCDRTQQRQEGQDHLLAYPSEWWFQVDCDHCPMHCHCYELGGNNCWKGIQSDSKVGCWGDIEKTMKGDCNE